MTDISDVYFNVAVILSKWRAHQKSNFEYNFEFSVFLSAFLMPLVQWMHAAQCESSSGWLFWLMGGDWPFYDMLCLQRLLSKYASHFQNKPKNKQWYHCREWQNSKSLCLLCSYICLKKYMLTLYFWVACFLMVSKLVCGYLCLIVKETTRDY